MADNTESTTFRPPSMAGEPKSYGLSGKIMLSAIVILFAVVIIMVCLHIYARWYILRTRRRQIRRARRRTHLVFYVEPNNPSNIIPIPTRGLDASVLKSLPTFTYRKGNDVEEREIGCLECAVCLSEFEEGEKGRVLPKCNHSFHVDCIDMWFHSHSTCPICRATVEGGDLNVDSEVPVELSVLTQDPPSQGPSSEERVGSSQSEVPCSSSVSARRKGLDLVGVSIEVPRRSQSFSFTNMDESGPSRSPSGFKSPTSRILSLKRILSREKKSPLPSPSGPGTSCVAGESATEFDVELGGVEQVRQMSPVVTPR